MMVSPADSFEIKTCLIIPCYNEERSLNITHFREFAVNNKNVLLCFVNDGSTDNTLKILQKIKAGLEQKIEVISLVRNKGKAEAVRQGVIHCNSHFDHTRIGFLDADLSTSMQEWLELSYHICDHKKFVFGSRIMKLGSNIERNFFRFLIGRSIATIISMVLGLKVYDTQCGCKLFERGLSEKLFRESFISKWLFDVELFFRMLIMFDQSKAVSKMVEIPLKQWVDKGDSKVKITYACHIWYDLFRISFHYKKRVLKPIINTQVKEGIYAES